MGAGPESPVFPPKHREPRSPPPRSPVVCHVSHCRLWGKPGGPNWAGRPATSTPGSCPRASAVASAAAMPSCAAAAACRMLITGTMRQRKSGRSGTMSGPQGLSQAKRDGGRSCRSQGTAWGLLRGGMESGDPRAPGRGGAASALLPPERSPFFVGGARELLQAHYPKKGPSSLPRAEG